MSSSLLDALVCPLLVLFAFAEPKRCGGAAVQFHPNFETANAQCGCCRGFGQHRSQQDSGELRKYTLQLLCLTALLASFPRMFGYESSDCICRERKASLSSMGEAFSSVFYSIIFPFSSFAGDVDGKMGILRSG